MTVEIWSDVVCPFCYIGKRHFETALAQFPNKDKVEVITRSFELDPQASWDGESDLYDILSTKYGRNKQWAVEMSKGVTQQAAQIGLTFNFDKSIPANTFNAHRLIHFASQAGLQHKAEERLFVAYFTEGKNVNDVDTLVELASEIGLNTTDVRTMLASDELAMDVRADEHQARAFGINAVPFFVINRKYAVRGAQPVDVFLQTLQTAWAEEQPILTEVAEPADGCADGACEIN